LPWFHLREIWLARQYICLAERQGVLVARFVISNVISVKLDQKSRRVTSQRVGWPSRFSKGMNLGRRSRTLRILGAGLEIRGIIVFLQY
jgi:hypothetical protein